MARHPAATRSKWVRFPPAFLTTNYRFGLHLFAKENRYLNYHLVGGHNRKLDCLLGLHRNYDGPKVAIFGRPKGSEHGYVSRRYSRVCPLLAAEAAGKSGNLDDHFVELLQNKATAGLEYMVRARWRQRGRGFKSRRRTKVC